MHHDESNQIKNTFVIRYYFGINKNCIKVSGTNGKRAELVKFKFVKIEII